MEFTFSINQKEASIHLVNHNVERPSGPWGKHGFAHHAILHKTLNIMRDRGFQVGRDPYIEENFKILSKDRWYGRKGDLEFKAERYPAGFKLEFFQNVIIKNPAGGYYDFDKYSKMPYMTKLMFRNEVRHIKAFLENLECIDDSISMSIYKNSSQPLLVGHLGHFRKRSFSIEKKQ